jgi:hypothetical protein
LLAAVLIVTSAGLRATYLAVDCPLDLAPDEAHYWDWSRHLDLSYYSKGPLVAYLIRGGCELAGGWTQPGPAGEMWAVRLPAVLCGSLLLVSLYLLTVQVFGREKLAAAVVAVALTLPVIGVGSSLMTIDAPYACCWGWALVVGHHAIFRRAAWAWPVAGLVVGIGILAKYTMVIWLPSLTLFLLTVPGHRRLLTSPGFWVMCAVAAFCCLPILIWNVQHDWVTLRHVNRLAGQGEGIQYRWLGPTNYVLAQCGLFLVFWFVAWIAAMWANRPWKALRPERAYLWWMSAPMFSLFLLFSVKTGGGEPNWPVTAYISGLVLAVAWLAERWRSHSAWQRRLTRIGLTGTCVLGLAVNVFMHESTWLYPVLRPLAGPPSEQRPLPLRRFDPTCRLRGWAVLADAVDRLCDEVRARGEEPVLAATSWSLPGELGFYCKCHPIVYSVGLPLGDRHSQYDLWRPNPVADVPCFAGRTFVVVGPYRPEVLLSAFARIESFRVVTHYESGQPVAQWMVSVVSGFRGFPRAAWGESY